VSLITLGLSLDYKTEGGLAATDPITVSSRPFFWQQMERTRANFVSLNDLAPIKMAQVTLTDAQIKALPTTAVTLITATGSGTFIKVISVVYASNFTAGAYTNLNATYVDLSLFLDTYYASYGFVKDTTTTPPITSITDMFASASVKIYEMGQPSVVAFAGAPGYATNINMASSGALNQPLTVKADNSGSNFTGGNSANTLKVTVLYLVL